MFLALLYCTNGFNNTIICSDKEVIGQLLQKFLITVISGCNLTLFYGAKICVIALCYRYSAVVRIQTVPFH